MAILYGCTLTVAHVFGVFISSNIFEKPQFKPIWKKNPSHCEYIPKQDPGYTVQKSVIPKQRQYSGAGSAGGNGRYMMVLGQYGAVLVVIWWY